MHNFILISLLGLKFNCENDRALIGFENLINFSPDGKLIACRGAEVKVFRVKTGELAAVCKVDGTMVCWNTRGTKLAIVTTSVNTKGTFIGNIFVFDM